MKPKALLSIHDVMPETLAAVHRCLELLRRHGVERSALLVVPGAGWSPPDLRALRALADAGHELLAHGWHHRTQPSGLYHRLHAACFSRDVAEHLALDTAGISALMARSRGWFEAQGLPVPAGYVPPAWALGRLRGTALAGQPFAVVETLRGVYLRGAEEDFRFTPLPLVGFEADTALRAALLGRWNRLQLRRCRRLGLPLRIALHPGDPDLRLADQLRAVLALGWTAVPYAALAGDGDAPVLCA